MSIDIATHPTRLGLVTVNGSVAQVLKPFHFYLNGNKYEVPLGFMSDGASVPWIFHWYARPFDKAIFAAVLHDYYYRSMLIARNIADWLFLKVMLATGVRRSKAYVMYSAVRGFAGFAYGNTAPVIMEI